MRKNRVENSYTQQGNDDNGTTPFIKNRQGRKDDAQKNSATAHLLLLDQSPGSLLMSGYDFNSAFTTLLGLNVHTLRAEMSMA